MNSPTRMPNMSDLRSEAARELHEDTVHTLLTAAPLEGLVQTGAAAQVRLSEMIGAIKMSRVNEEFSRVAHIKMLAEVKDSEAYKGLHITAPEGALVTCKSWEQFVASLGIGSVDTIDEQIRFLGTFGEQFLEAAQGMRLGYLDLRRLRKLPEEDRAAVVSEVEANLADKDSILALIDGLADRHARENVEKDGQIGKLTKDLEKKTRQVDAIVKAETEALEAERDALLSRTNELETQLGGGDWDKTNAAARKLSDQVQDIKRGVESLLRLMPTDKPLPTPLAADIGASLFHLQTLAQTLWVDWEDRAGRHGAGQ